LPELPELPELFQSDMPIYIPVILFITFSLIYTVLIRGLVSERLRITSRLQKQVIDPADRIRTEMELDFDPEEIADEPRRRSLRQRLEGAGPIRRLLIRIQDRLDRANLLLRAQEFLLIMLALAMVLGLAGFLIRGIIGGLLFAVAGLIAPWLYVGRARSQRMAAITRQLPDTLMLISNGLKAGHGFLQAAELVAQEMDAPMGEEFRRFLRETTLGSTTEAALNNLNERCDNDDLDLAVTAVLIQRQIGGNLAEILDSILHTIRERIRIKQEIRTLTAQGRLSAIIITALPPVLAVIVYFLSPEFISVLFTTTIGIAMIVAAVISEVIGGLIIRKIVDIEV